MYLEIPYPLVKTDSFVLISSVGTGNRFQHKSFRYELKQWNCTKISFTVKYSLLVNKKNILGEYIFVL